MISLSPLPTAHPSTFQRKPVRASRACYGSFTLAMGRSLGFASAPPDLSALLRLALASAHIPEGLNLAGQMQLVGSLCKRHAVACAPTACKRTVSGSISLPCSGCFPPFLHSTGSLSVFCEYLALRDGPRGFRQDFTCPALLRRNSYMSQITCTGLSPAMVELSRTFHFFET